METTSCIDATTYVEESCTYGEDDVIKVMVPFEPLTGAGRPFTFLLWRRLTEEELLAFLHFHRASQPAVQDAVRQYRRRRRQCAVANRESGSVRHLTSQKREVCDGAHVNIGLASGDMGIVKTSDGSLPSKGHAKTTVPRSTTCDHTRPSDSQLPGMISKE